MTAKHQGDVLNKRGEERVSASFPVTLGGASEDDFSSATTRDVSASGIFFETDAVLSIGSMIQFSVELDMPGGRSLLKCTGSVVRTESSSGRAGVAVKITDSRLERCHTNVQPRLHQRHSLR